MQHNFDYFLKRQMKKFKKIIIFHLTEHKLKNVLITLILSNGDKSNKEAAQLPQFLFIFFWK